MSLTLEDLKKLELPVKLIKKEQRIGSSFNEIEVLHIGNIRLFHRREDGQEITDRVDFILENYKLAPRTKIVEREYWVNVYPNYISGDVPYKEVADENATSNRLFCKHIKMKYEVDADTGAFIREIE